MKTESPKRSIAKSISWRIVASLTTIALSWLFTKDIKIALGIGAVEVVAKLIIYYFHERAWIKIQRIK